MAERFDIWAPKFRNALGQFARVRNNLLKRAAKYAETRAKGYAPVLTGELRSSIEGTTEATGTGSVAGNPRVFLSAPRKYAPIEFGSRRGHIAQRFLERGMDDAIDWLEKTAADELEDLLIGRGRVGHIGPRFSGRSR